MIASLLTLASVNKRTREIGTLKAVGWRQWLVIRQISGESVAQGLFGGAVGAALGIAGALVIDALGITLKATVASQSSGFGPPGGGPFGQGQVSSGASSVALNAPVDAGVLLLAIAWPSWAAWSREPSVGHGRRGCDRPRRFGASNERKATDKGNNLECDDMNQRTAGSRSSSCAGSEEYGGAETTVRASTASI